MLWKFLSYVELLVFTALFVEFLSRVLDHTSLMFGSRV